MDKIFSLSKFIKSILFISISIGISDFCIIGSASTSSKSINYIYLLNVLIAFSIPLEDASKTYINPSKSS